MITSYKIKKEMKNKIFIYLDKNLNKKSANYQPFYLSIIFDKEKYQMLMDYFADYKKKHKSYGGVLNNVSFRFWNFYIKNYKTVWFKLLNYDGDIILEAGNEILWGSPWAQEDECYPVDDVDFNSPVPELFDVIKQYLIKLNQPYFIK